jgi:hypothetical protein
MQSDDLCLALFATAKSSDFQIAALTPDGVVAAEVTARLDRLTPGAVTPGYEQFAMLFIGPVEPLLPQGTYRFRHATLGERALFMVPVGQDAQGTQYEVCVARKLD